MDQWRQFDESLRWLRFILNDDTIKPDIKDWLGVYNFAEKQSLIGICDPTSHNVRMPEDLLFQWIGDVQTIRDQNKLLKHIKFPMFTDMEVDVHHAPLRFLNPKYSNLLQKWLTEQKDEQMNHYVSLPETSGYIAVPTAKFNAVYLLGHIMVHLFDEGVGFRQLIDYYYVLKEVSGLSQEDRDDIVRTWKRLGMLKLASAVMWIEAEILGIGKRCLLTVTNERLGRLLLEDVLEGGNFGDYSARQSYISNGNRFAKRVLTLRRLVRMLPCFPGEAAFRIPHRFAALSKVYWRKIVLW